MDILHTILPGLISTLIIALASGATGWFANKSAKLSAESKARDQMLVSMGKLQLTDLHQRYVVSGEGCPIWVKDEAEGVYNAYHALGGNGIGTHLYEEIRDAPVDPRRGGETNEQG